ncbi:fungal-specific transcription factor domain-containing protein [Mycena epipterygia]|nr:fungal-specific transcription factor domain-containing protein [Mycena epipterygia]
MSSYDEGISREGQDMRTWMAPRPCDVCRRRKTRCEGSQIPGAKCATCLAANLECTYRDPARKRESKSRYVTDLETQVKYLETHVAESETIISDLRTEIARLCEELAAAQAQLDAQSFSNSSTHSSPPSDPESNAVGSISTSAGQQQDPTLQILRKGLDSVSEPPLVPDAEDPLDLELERKMDALTMDTPRGSFAKMGSAPLVRAALLVKEDVQRRERHTATVQSMSTGTKQGTSAPYVDANEGAAEMAQRPGFWMFKPWESTALTHTHTYRFPPPDLVAHLAELYFTRAHIYLPLLHRPTFDRSVELGMQHWDDDFAAILLLVCAIGSRWSHDPRVLLPTSNGKPHLECGWEWFNQVIRGPFAKHLFRQVKLCDLQYYCLAAHFLLGSASGQPAGWMLVGIGLRLAQETGAHRSTTHAEEPPAERELWKRAFWVLVFLDRQVSALRGRTCLIQYDDFDVELPLECDDEYWEDPTHPFQQPPGVPSRIAFFNALLRLSHIMATGLKALYSVPRTPIGPIKDGWAEQFVADLASALNRWRDEVPEHLSWDPARADPVFFDQSVALHCGYFNLQIMVHRSYIPVVCKVVPPWLPAMALCTNAARACANVVDVQRRRKGNEPVNFHMSYVFNSALVLLLNLWSGRLTGLAPDSNRDLENVHKCMEVLRLCEDRWSSAGMLRDVLAALASAGQRPAQSSSLSYAQAYGEPHDAGASDTAQQPMSSEDLEMLRMLFKSPTLQQTFAFTSHEPQYAPPYVPQYFAAGGEMPPMDADMLAASTWLASEAPFAMDASSNAGNISDYDMVSTWMTAPNGIEDGDDNWGSYFSSG